MSASPKSFVLFASGEGTNAEVLIRAAKEKSYTVLGLIVDREAPAQAMAKRLDVPTFLIPHKEEEKLLLLLNELNPSWAFLAGYKRILGEKVLQLFSASNEGYSRILNIHPSLLPSYPGLHSYERAFKDGVKLSGVTVHLVDAGLDTGLPVIQKEFMREDRDTLESFTAKGKAIEHEIYPRALCLALENKIHFKNLAGSRWISLEEK